MKLYSPDFILQIAVLTEIGPISSAAATGPDALQESPYLPVLNAYMEPLAELYRDIFAEKVALSDAGIFSKSMEISEVIVKSFLVEVCHESSIVHKKEPL